MLSNLQFNRLNPDWATLHANEVIVVEEKKESGRAKVNFEASAPSLHLRHLDDRPPLKWAKNGKCADSAIIVETEAGLCLHVVELKTKLSTRDWISVRQQFEGMIANAIAALAVIDGERPTKVVCHISYLSENVSSHASPDLIFLKFPVGGAAPLGDSKDWDEGKLELFGYKSIPLRKIVRDPTSGEAIGDLSDPD